MYVRSYKDLIRTIVYSHQFMLTSSPAGKNSSSVSGSPSAGSGCSPSCVFPMLPLFLGISSELKSPSGTGKSFYIGFTLGNGQRAPTNCTDRPEFLHLVRAHVLCFSWMCLPFPDAVKPSFPQLFDSKDEREEQDFCPVILGTQSPRCIGPSETVADIGAFHKFYCGHQIPMP